MIDIVIVDDLNKYMREAKSEQPVLDNVIYIKKGEFIKERDYTKEYLKVMQINDGTDTKE